MRNPTYAGGFASSPMPERASQCSFVEGEDSPLSVLSMGIKIITHSPYGLKLYPHATIVIEITSGDEVASFAIPPSMARHYALKLTEFADTIESGKDS